MRAGLGLVVALGLVSAWASLGSAAVGDIKTFTDPAGHVTNPETITLGPDGNLWFTDDGSTRIGMITTAGAITTFPDAGLNSPFGITKGPDGALWFTERNSATIGRVTTAGAFSYFTDGTNLGQGNKTITTGPDGALWFTNTQKNNIGASPPPASSRTPPADGQQPEGHHDRARRRALVHQRQ